MGASKASVIYIYIYMIKLVYFSIVSLFSTLEKTFLLEEKTTVNSQQLFSHMVRDDIFFRRNKPDVTYLA